MNYFIILTILIMITNTGCKGKDGSKAFIDEAPPVEDIIDDEPGDETVSNLCDSGDHSCHDPHNMPNVTEEDCMLLTTIDPSAEFVYYYQPYNWPSWYYSVEDEGVALRDSNGTNTGHIVDEWVDIRGDDANVCSFHIVNARVEEGSVTWWNLND